MSGKLMTTVRNMAKLVSFVVAGVFATASTVQAVPLLRLTQGASVVTIVDNGVLDLDPTVGLVVFSGSVGFYTVNVATGVTQPLVGTTTTASIDLNSINTANSHGGALSVLLTNTGFTQGVGSPSGVLSWSWGGTTTASPDRITGQGYIDPTNGAFVPGSITTGLLGPFSGAFSTSGQLAHGALLNPYSMTIGLNLFSSGTGTFSGNFALDNTSPQVPEPGSLMLLGSGLFGIGFAARQFRKDKKHEVK